MNADFPAKTVKELVDLVKKNPGKYNYAMPGTGTTPHLAGELFKLTFKLDLATVPFNGAGPAIQSAVAGHTPVALTALPPTAPQVQAGQTSRARGHRDETLVGAARCAHHGRSRRDRPGIGDDAGHFYTRGTPKDIVELLNREIAKAMVLPDVKEKCAQLGFDAVANTPDEFALYIKKEVDKWSKVIKDANIPQIQ